MSSDSFADLAGTAGEFAGGLRGLLGDGQRPAVGSPAAADAVNEELGGEWGQFPARGVFGELVLAALSCADHLAAAAVVIRERSGPAPLYTLMRGAAEAAATGGYLSGADVDDRERVRRYMNRRLAGLCAEITMVSEFSSPQAQAEVTHLEGRVAEIGRSARQNGFGYRGRDRYRAAYLGDKPPSVTWLISRCSSRVPMVGATYYRLLSGVAHAQPHGLARFLIAGGDGLGRVMLNSTAADLARDLLAGPLCAATLVEHLGWYPGWDCDAARSLATRMVQTWGRIADVPAAA